MNHLPLILVASLLLSTHLPALPFPPAFSQLSQHPPLHLQSLLNVPPPSTHFLKHPLAGLTEDFCRHQTDCVSPRRCETHEGKYLVPCNVTGSTICYCLPPERQACNASSQCPQGERCMILKTQNKGHCFSCTSSRMDEIADTVDTPNCPSPSPHPTPHGFLLDSCSADPSSSCRAPRSCTRLDNTKDQIHLCKPGDTDCRCWLHTFPACSNSTQCSVGERCAGLLTNNSHTMCRSCTIVQQNPHAFQLTEANTSNCNTPPPTHSPPSSSETTHHCPPSLGLSFDHCCSVGQCAFPRKCLSRSFRRCTEELGCACLLKRISTCTNSSTCSSGERCVKRGSNGDLQVCMSCQRVKESTAFVPLDDGGGRCEELVWKPPAVDNGREDDDEDDSLEGSPGPSMLPSQAPAQSKTPPTPPPPPSYSPGPPASSEQEGRSAACVAVKHLRGLATQHLVFQQHRLATVLCDMRGSCATHGHIVIWKGRTMTMSRYCMQAQCQEKQMLVNSPHMKRGLRVDSQTSGLLFTALAARWASYLEEKILSIFVKIGF